MSYMLKTLELELSDKKIKPVFHTAASRSISIVCLFDTGAMVPVWCGSKKFFDFVFPDAVLYDKNLTLSGFGKLSECVDVYKIPVFCIADGKHKLEFRNLLVAASFDRDFDCDLVLSYTMFAKVNYSVINIGNSMPKLRIEYSRDYYGISPAACHGSNDKLSRISVFTSERT